MKKIEARAKYKTLRNSFSEEQIKKESIQIARLCIEQFKFNTLNAVHLFLPIEESLEINTFELYNRLDRQFPLLKICVPKTDFENHSMTHIVMRSTTELIKNDYNIPEPKEGKAFTKQFDIIFCPLLAYDKNGNRVGYGKGFYDEFLSQQTNAIKVGLSFFPPEEIIEDIDEHDIKLDFCITPTEVFKFQ